MRIVRLPAILSVAVLVFSLVALAWPAKTSAAADTCTWTGTTSANWSVGTNWSGCDNGGVPQDGDNLVFPGGGAHLATTNDVLITAADVTFSGDGYSVSGNSMHLSGSLHLYGAATINTSLAFISSTASNRTLDYQNEGAVLPSTVSLSLTNGANFLLFSTVPSLPMPSFSGLVNELAIIGSGTGGQRQFIATSPSTVAAAGGVRLARATVLCQNSSCLGSPSNAVSITNGNNRGAELNLFTDDILLPYDITLDSGGFDGPPTLSTTGNNTEVQGDVSVVTAANVEVGSGKALTFGNGGGTVTIGSGATAVLTGDGDILMQDEITGSGVLNVVGSHVVASGNNATFSGRVVVDPDGIFDADGTALGTTDTAINDGGSWRITNSADQVISNHVSVGGSGNSTSNAAVNALGQAVTFSGTVTTSNNGVINHASTAGKTVTFANTINGDDNLTLERTSGSASNAYVLAPLTDNNFTGDLHVVGAKATLSGTALSVPHNLYVRANSNFDAEVVVSTAGQLNDTSTVDLTNNATKVAKLTVNTPTTTVGKITGNGTVGFLSTGRNLRVGNGDASSTFNGALSGSGNTITKVGSGTWTLGSGATAAVGNAPTFAIEGGTLSLNGSLASAPITAASGSTLKGSGTIGAATIQGGAAINVGNSPGCMTMSSLSLASGATFDEEIAGNTACSSYDQTTVTGTASLNNATLHVDLSYAPAPGTTFTILKAGAVNGTFNGLPDGASVTANGVTFRIHYTTTAVTLEYAAGALASSGSGTLANTGLQVLLAAAAATTIAAAAIAVRFTRRRKIYQLYR